MSLLLLLFGFLLFSSAFFSSSETAIFSLSRVHIHKLKESRRHAARRVVECLRHPRQMLVTILIGNEFANVAMSIVGAAIISRLFPVGIETRTFIAVVLVTPIILLLGEILPKNVALRTARDLAPLLIVPLEMFHRLVAPIRYVLSGIADMVVRLFGGKPEAAEPMIREEEFRRLVDLGKKEGIIIEEEQALIHNVFEFTEKVVKDIMTPADRLFRLPVNIAYEQMLEEIRATTFSRVPFYEGDENNIVGILHVRDLFAFDRARRLPPPAGESDTNIIKLFRAPLFIEMQTRLEELLKNFQERQIHMALVRDEKEKVVGVVTLDDVLQELFGEISVE